MAEGANRKRLARLVHDLQDAMVDVAAGEAEARALIEAEPECAKAAAGWVALQHIAETESRDVPRFLAGKIAHEDSPRAILLALRVLAEEYNPAHLFELRDAEPLTGEALFLSRWIVSVPPGSASLRLLARLDTQTFGMLVQPALRGCLPDELLAAFGAPDPQAALAAIHRGASEPFVRAARLTTRGAPSEVAGAKRKAKPRKSQAERYIDALASADSGERLKVLWALEDHLHEIPAEFEDALALAILQCMDDPVPECRWAACARAWRLREIANHEVKRRIATTLLAAASGADANTRSAALSSLGVFAALLDERDREVVVDALLEKAHNPTQPSWRSGWHSLNEMRDAVPDGRVLTLFPWAAQFRLEDGLNETTRDLFRVLLPRAMAQAPDLAVDWLLTFHASGRYGAVQGLAYPLGEMSPGLEPRIAGRLVEGLVAYALPPDAAHRLTVREPRMCLFEALFALAALRGHLSGDLRQRVIAGLAQGVESGWDPTTQEFLRFFGDYADEVPEEQAITFAAGFLHAARAAGDRRKGGALRPAVLLRLAACLSPGSRAELSRALEKIGGQTSNEDLRKEARDCAALLARG